MTKVNGKIWMSAIVITVFLHQINLLSQPPIIDRIAPGKGIIGFSQTVLIKGSNFHGSLQVLINRQSVDFQIIGENLLVIETLPDLPVGQIVIINTSGQVEVSFEKVPVREVDFIELIGSVQGLFFDVKELTLDKLAFELFSIGEQSLSEPEKVKYLDKAYQKWKDVIVKIDQSFKDAISDIRVAAEESKEMINFDELRPWIDCASSSVTAHTEFLLSSLQKIKTAAQEGKKEAVLEEIQLTETIIIPDIGEKPLEISKEKSRVFNVIKRVFSFIKKVCNIIKKIRNKLNKQDKSQKKKNLKRYF